MRLLLDSHTVIWAADDPTQLSVLAQQLIQDPSHDRLISAATIWEMAIKFGLKKLYAAACLQRDSRHSAKLGFHDFQDRTLLARWIIDVDEDWDSSLD
jgi:PIN domain nuclease of toxin-antitoxin system